MWKREQRNTSDMFMFAMRGDFPEIGHAAARALGNWLPPEKERFSGARYRTT
jgi:hypothetical protein